MKDGGYLINLADYKKQEINKDSMDIFVLEW